MKNNTTINRFGIYYIPRKYLEDGLSSKIKWLKKLKNKLAKNLENYTEVENEIVRLSSNRPCIVVKKYKSNVYVMPITNSSSDETHLETKVFNKKKTPSYIKTSVIVTFSSSRFKSLADRLGNIRIPEEERQILLSFSKKHYFE